MKLLLQHNVSADQVVQHVREAAVRASAALPPLQVQYCAKHGGWGYSKAFKAWSSLRGKEAEAPSPSLADETEEAEEEADEWHYERAQDPDARGTMKCFARDILGRCPGFEQLMLVYHKLGVADVLADVAEATEDGSACLSHDPALVRAAQQFQQEQAVKDAAEPSDYLQGRSCAFVDHLLATGECDWDCQFSFSKKGMQFASFLLLNDNGEHPAWGVEGYSLEELRFDYGRGGVMVSGQW
jgi:hypothetical protein